MCPWGDSVRRCSGVWNRNTFVHRNCPDEEICSGCGRLRCCSSPRRRRLTWPRVTPRLLSWRRSTIGAVSISVSTVAAVLRTPAGTSSTIPASRSCRQFPRGATTRQAPPSVDRSAIAGRRPTGCSAWKRRATGPILGAATRASMPSLVPPLSSTTSPRSTPSACSRGRSDTPSTTCCSMPRAVRPSFTTNTRSR